MAKTFSEVCRSQWPLAKSFTEHFFSEFPAFGAFLSRSAGVPGVQRVSRPMSGTSRRSTLPNNAGADSRHSASSSGQERVLPRFEPLKGAARGFCRRRCSRSSGSPRDRKPRRRLCMGRALSGANTGSRSEEVVRTIRARLRLRPGQLGRRAFWLVMVSVWYVCVIATMRRAASDSRRRS